MHITPEQPSHWYKPDGTPAYGATLREARQEGLYPSVTSVAQVIGKPALVAWSQSLLLDSMWEILWEVDSYDDGDDDKQFMIDSIVARWKEKKSAAAEFGTLIHDAIEECLKNSVLLNDQEELAKYVNPAVEWCDSNSVTIEGIEESFAHPLGYGGRVDLHGAWGTRQRPFTLDWKTTKSKDGRFRFYDDYAIQLAANAAGLGKVRGDLISVLISTTEPGLIEHKVWGDNVKWHSRFVHRLQVWMDEKKYNPLEVKNE